MDPLRILQFDDSVIWVDKPSGLLSVPGKGLAGADCAVGRLAAEFGWVREAHRLDMDTSGVMVLARTAEVHRALCRQFRERVPRKRYETLVAGHPAAHRGRIELPMRLDVARRPLQIVDFEQGKPALTGWEVLERRADGTTRMVIEPLTGRSHQIRLHLASIGHPILGDDLYAPEPARSLRDRLCLHATYLEIEHPVTRRRTAMSSPCPF